MFCLVSFFLFFLSPCSFRRSNVIFFCSSLLSFFFVCTFVHSFVNSFVLFPSLFLQFLSFFLSLVHSLLVFLSSVCVFVASSFPSLVPSLPYARRSRAFIQNVSTFSSWNGRSSDVFSTLRSRPTSVYRVLSKLHYVYRACPLYYCLTHLLYTPSYIYYVSLSYIHTYPYNKLNTIPTCYPLLKHHRYKFCNLY